MAEGTRSTGTVKWFSAQKGFGFIAPDDGGEDLFVHQTSIQSDGFRTLSEGQPVEFAVDFGEDGRTKAVDVVGVSRSRRAPRGSRGGGSGSGFYGGRGRGSGGLRYNSGRGDGGYGTGGRGGRSGSGSTGGGFGGGGGGSCYNCGRFGHLARDCYQSGGGSGGGGGGNRGYGDGSGRGRGGGGYSGGGGGACYNCGEEGHFARDCPNTDQN